MARTLTPAPPLLKERPAPVSGLPIHWPYLLPILAIHLLALAAFIPAYFSWTGLALFLIGTHVFGGWGINIGYHRLLAHHSFRTYTWFKRFLALMAICSLQDTPARWVATHRLHHRHADEDEDPHSPIVDLYWSHIGWLFRRNPTQHDFGFYQKYAHDVLQDRFFMWLEKRPAMAGWIYLAQAAVYFLVAFGVGLLAGSSSSESAQWGLSIVVWGVILRTVAVWHITWSVNSLTHLFGYRNYETGENSRNNWLVAILAAGEGWHNNHHWDPAGVTVRHKWWEFDLTYCTIFVFRRLGLAWELIPPRPRRDAQRAKPGESLTVADALVE